MSKDLRTWLRSLEQEFPEELVRVSREVNPAAFEATARNAVMGIGAPVYTSGAHM